MNISVAARSDLLKNLRTYLVDNVPENNRYIYFYSSGSPNALCSLKYSDITTPSITGGKATYTFVAIDGVTLRNIVSLGGKVSSFKISGRVLIADSLDSEFVVGTVGSFSSSSDMKFNKLQWEVGMNVTVTNLMLVMQ